MNQVNGTTSQKKKQVLFSIGSYGEREKRVINKISTNGLFTSSAITGNASVPSRTLPKTRPVSLNFLDSTAKYQTLPARHRYQDGLNVEKPLCPPSACNSPTVVNGPIAEKQTFPPKFLDRSLSLEPEQLRHSGRVALTIAAYEGEPRNPTRLDFLPSGRISRASSKSSSSTSSTPSEDVDGSRMMLQNELVATLKRSNLKKLTEDNVFQKNGTPDSTLDKSKSAEEPKITDPIEIPENNKTTDEPKTVEVVEASKNIEIAEESKNVKVTEEIKSIEITEKPQTVRPVEETEIKKEIDAALTELDNSTEEVSHEELKSIPPPPPPLPELNEPTVKKELEPSKLDLENVELIEEVPVTAVLSNNNAPKEVTKESKDEIDVSPNGSVKQLAVELGKKMTFKADIERVPEQNCIKND